MAQSDDTLEVVAHSPDFPVDPTASQRAFSAPKINERGQVLFSASWFKNYPQSQLRLGRPGNLATIVTAGDSVPGAIGMIFKGGPNVGTSAPVGVSNDTLNAKGETLFWSDTLGASQGAPLLFTTAVFKGGPGALTLVATAPFNESNPGAVPATPVAGVPYAGTGRLQFSNDDGFKFHPPRPWLVADDGRAYYYANIDALEGGAIVPIATECLIEAGSSGSRLIWYKGGPAPGLGGNFVFESFLFGPDSVGQKSGDFAALTTVRPAGSTDPQTFKLVFYQSILGNLLPFYTDGDPIFGAPNLSQITAADGAIPVDRMGNTLVILEARDAAAGGALRKSLWKKVPAGLTRVVGLGEDVTTVGGTVRFVDSQLGASIEASAIGGGKAAFLVRFTGLGQTSTPRGIFREGAAGLEALAWAGMAIPGTTPPQTFGNDIGTLAPLAMNESGEVAFLTSYLDQGVTRRGLFRVDTSRGIHRVAGTGQVVTVGGTPRTIASFLLPTEAGLAPVSQMFNDAGQTVFTARFTDGTTAVLRSSPAGYAEPPLLGQDFYFTGAKGDNWHAKGGAPVTNWESSGREVRPDAPGDIEVDSAQVFVPAGKSVLLNARPAFIGSIDAAGELKLQHHLRVSQASTLKDVQAQGANAALTVGATTVISGITDWSTGTITLSASELRNTGVFSAGFGIATGAGAGARFVNTGRLIKGVNGTFTYSVPFVSNQPNDPNVPTTVEVRSSATLRLQAGGTFTGYNSFETSSPTAVLELTGKFDLNGISTDIFGPGFIELGSTTSDVNLDLANGSALYLGRVGKTRPRITFHRGALTGATVALKGLTVLENGGIFSWRGGRIAIGTRTGILSSFSNIWYLEIEDSPVPRELDGQFFNTNLGSVVQRAAFEHRGHLVNAGNWAFERSAAITDPSGLGLIVNEGHFTLQGADTGTVDVDTAFQCADGSAPFHSVGEVVVFGSPTAKNILRFRGNVGNLRPGGVLAGGIWTVIDGGTLSLPSNVSEIGPNTDVRLFGGEFPALLLRKNSGKFQVASQRYATPAALESPGTLVIYKNGILAVSGDLNSSGDVTCELAGELRVNGVLIQRAGRLMNEGTVNVTSGDIRCDPRRISGNGKYVLPQGTFVFMNGVLQPGNSPGTFTVEGALALESPTTTEVELAGPAPDQYDRLSVTRGAALGGTLLVTLLNDFKPAASQTFAILQAGSLTRAFANVASGQRITTTDGTGSFAVYYGPGSPHGPNNVVLADWQPSPAGSPTITSQPKTAALIAGGPTTLSVTPGGSGPFTFQWQRGGTNIAGATTANYTIPSVQLTDDGLYSVVVSNAAGSVRSTIADLAVAPPPPSNARLLNLSTRALAQTGDRLLIPGFVVTGTETKRVLIRGIGPTLASFGIGGTLANPQLQLFRGSEIIASNDDWGVPQAGVSKANLVATAAAVGAFALPDGSKDAVLLADLPPGAYTVQASGVADGTGVAIVELYDADSGTPTATLSNISTRGFVGTGEAIMIPGIVLSQEGPRTFLVRAVGPTLAQFGVGGTLADPALTIVRDGATILSNDDWSAAPGAEMTAATAAQVGAFALPAGSKDAALAVTLPPGAYTVLVSGKNNSTGVVLVEVYLVP